MTATISAVAAADTASSTVSSSATASSTSHLAPSPLLPVESALLELHSSEQSLQQLLSAARSEYYGDTHPIVLEQLVPAFAQLDVYCRKMDDVKTRLQRASKRVASIKQRTAALDADVAGSNSNSSKNSSTKQPIASPPAAAQTLASSSLTASTTITAVV